METPKIIIDLDEYNKLINFQKAIEDGNSIQIRSTSYYSYSEKIITTDEAIKKLAEYNKELSEKLSDVMHRLYEKTEDSEQIKKIKRMTILQFLKYRKS